ncbi:DUF4479 and tRNA-binding domain-containing protein [Streptococcaceae bacterium ESL0687]|nr:DUF4479 and tRNA-binding domain-containing protein [Streptococcaceae bacterium ESL0687]
MIAVYNQNLKDVLMFIVANDEGADLDFVRKGQVARIFREDTGQTVAWNIFEASSVIDIIGNGQVDVEGEDLEKINALLMKEGFDQVIPFDDQPKFVVGEIVDLKAHEDSDHLNIAQVKISDDETVQIVAGAPNARLGLKTIVALPGAMMPNGSLIFAGELRGVPSYGMMASPRELALPNAPQKRGIIELDSQAVVGEKFNPEKHWQG